MDNGAVLECNNNGNESKNSGAIVYKDVRTMEKNVKSDFL